METEKSHGDSTDLYAWIDTIPFSKPKRNLTKDFSDAVLMAEILKFYYPRYVDLHNYVPANSLNTKKENWSMLNRKVLTKIDMKLSKDMIHQLASAHQGAIEKLLRDLKLKISKPEHVQDSDPKNDIVCSEKEEEQSAKNESETNLSVSRSSSEVPEETANSFEVTNSKTKTYFDILWLVKWICFWTVLSAFANFFRRIFTKKKILVDACTEQSEPEKQLEPENANEENTVPRSLCSQLKQELREKDDLICTLNHKIAYLESAMKLKDLRISNLTSQIVQNAVEMDQMARSQGNTNGKLKSRVQ